MELHYTFCSRWSNLHTPANLKPFKFPLGIWTICLHPNNMNEFEINEFKKNICQEFYTNKFINLNSIEKYISILIFFQFY